MAVLEVPLFSGFRADVESLEQLLLGKRAGLKRYEVDGRKVLFYFDEIPGQCMTCVKFGAFREYVVGKTAPLPVRIYDYYEPAFEATRFYNVSESSLLARELCDGPTCNEVESAGRHWAGFVQGGRCDGVFGCLADGYFEPCSCARDCGYDGEPVCGSDGRRYPNRCQMEAAACRNNTPVEQVPLAECWPGGAGNMAEESKAPFQIHTDTAPTDEGPTLPLDFSYYGYDYDPSEPEPSEGDTFGPTADGAGTTVATPEATRTPWTVADGD